MTDPDLLDADAVPDHELIRRRDAAQAVKDHFETRKWRLGSADCARMVAMHLRLLGYQVRLPPEGSYRSVRTAKMKLLGLGHASVADALDKLGLERIAPAFAIVGDILQLPGEDENDLFAALTVALGNGRVIGWHPDVPDGAAVLQPSMFIAAWRTSPKEAEVLG